MTHPIKFLSPVTPYPVGGWAPSALRVLPSNFLTGAAGALTSGLLSLHPTDVGPKGLTIQSLDVQIVQLQVGGTVTSYGGIYADDGSGAQPDLTNLIDSATFATFIGGSAGFRSATISRTLPPGRYWIAFLYVVSSAPGTAPTLFSITNAAPPLYLTAGLSFSTTRGFKVTGPLSVLPTTAQTLVTSQSSTEIVVVCLRAA